MMVAMKKVTCLAHLFTNGCEEVTKFSVATSVLNVKNVRLLENGQGVCEIRLIVVQDQ